MEKDRKISLEDIADGKQLSDLLKDPNKLEEVYSSIPKVVLERAQRDYGQSVLSLAQKAEVIRGYHDALIVARTEVESGTAPIPSYVRKMEGFSDYIDALAQIYRSNNRF